MFDVAFLPAEACIIVYLESNNNRTLLR